MRFIALKDIGKENIIEFFSEVSKIFSYFQGKSFPNLLKEASLNGSLVSPSINGHGKAICKSGFFEYPLNFLYFRDEDQKSNFLVIQHLVFCYSLYLPKLNLIVVGDNNIEKAEKIIPKNLNEFKLGNEGVFNGILNGYHRPYHYFYDKLYPIFQALDEGVESSYINISGSFLELSEIHPSFQKRTSHNSDGFYIMPSKMEYVRTPRRFFEQLKIYINKSKKPIENEIKKYHHIFWFGLCLEKRKFIERDAVISELIAYLDDKYEKSLFVFDGMTREPNQDYKNFLEKSCLREIASFESIVSKNSKISTLNLIGATAAEKIAIAKYVDFYFSSYLTDSIWCAAIGARPGMVYRPKASVGRGSAMHPLSHVIPTEHVIDVGTSSTGDFDGQDISIDPVYLNRILANSIDLTLTLNDWLDSLKTNLISESNEFISPIFKTNLINGQSFAVKLDDYQRNIDSLIFRFKDERGNIVDILDVKKSFSIILNNCVNQFDAVLMTKRRRLWRPMVSIAVSL